MASEYMRTAGEFAEAIVRRLEREGQTVTFAESCTGGMVASTLVGVPGASHVFRESYVTYCDEAKHRLLGVSEETLAAHTAVSFKAAEEMAKGAAGRADADYAVAVTGYADGDEAHAGLVYIACAFRPQDGGLTLTREFHLTGDRNGVRRKAAYRAMKFLWEYIYKQDFDEL